MGAAFRRLQRRSYAVPFRQDSSAQSHGLGPFATPVLRDGRLFTFGVTSMLMARDAADGTLLWRRSSADQFDPGYPYFGAASSPLVWQDRVLVHLGGHPRGDTAGASPGAMVALRTTDGKELWRWQGDAPSVGASPVTLEVDGQPQIVFKTLRSVVGVDPRTGRELWRMPWVVTEDNTIVTPLVVDDRLMLSDFDLGVSVWALERRTGGWSAQPLWKSREASMSMSSPVLTGGSVVGFSHLRGGQLFLLDPATGEVTWRGPARRGEHASLVSWGDEVLVFTDDGWLTVYGVEDQRLVELARYRLGTSVGWSHPAVSDSRIVFRDGEDLVVVRLDRP